MKKLGFLLTLAIMLGAMPLKADEGMWLPSEIILKIKDMQEKGFKLTAEDIYSINNSSPSSEPIRTGSPPFILISNPFITQFAFTLRGYRGYNGFLLM